MRNVKAMSWLAVLLAACLAGWGCEHPEPEAGLATSTATVGQVPAGKLPGPRASHPPPGQRPVPATTNGLPEQPWEPGVLLVDFNKDWSERVDQTLAGELGLSLVERSVIGVYRMRLTTAESVPQAAERVSSDPRVRYAEPNYVIQLLNVPNDPRFDELWGMDNTGQAGGTAGADIDAVEAWDIAIGSRNVVVAVLDTGVDYTHPDLVDNIWTNPGEVAGNGVDDDGNGYIDDNHGWDFENEVNDPMDDYGHGTHCAGTIGASGNNGVGVAGVNWRVSIMPVRIIGGQDLNTYCLDAAEGVIYATDNGADVMSCSWWTVEHYSQTLEDAVAYSDAQGVILVAAAGNYSTNVETGQEVWPCEWTYPNIICVAATDNTDGMAYFSNWGAVSVDVGAPGVGILSTAWPNHGYVSMSGTSMATPHTAGLVGLIMSIRPDLTPAEIKQFLFTTVDPISDLQGITTTGGRINAFRVLQAVSGVPLPPAALAGGEQTVVTHSTVTLDGTASFDPNQDPITYAWDFYPPSTSTAALDDPASPTPRFFADMCGEFQAVLTVSDGELDSLPDIARVHVKNFTPVNPIIETSHPYGNGSDVTWTINQPAAAVMGVHFASFETESSFDFVRILDANDAEWAVYDGALGEFNSVFVDGDTVKVRFTSNGSVTMDGFVIDGYWWCGAGQCPPGRGDCDGDPVNGCETLTGSDLNCGWCGNVCAYPNADASCVGGACQFDGCHAGWTDCDSDPANGCEADLSVDPNHCSACGFVCGPYPNATPGCAGGTCVLGACDPGWDDCNGQIADGCEQNVSDDLNNCGACGDVCNLSHTTDHMCVDGVCTPGSCVEDPESIDSPHPYPNNYDHTWTLTKPGAEDVAVHFSLFETESYFDFVRIYDGNDVEYQRLDGSRSPFWSVAVPGDTIKIRLLTDYSITRNGITIDTSRYCAGGCEVNWGNCDGDPTNGCEADLLTALGHCGGCGQPCGAPGTDSQCTGGVCYPSANCLAGFGDCDGNAANGCEIDLADNVINCGMCGNVCAYDRAAEDCIDGNCAMGECETGWADCNAQDTDGCESSVGFDPDNCGACGNQCNLPHATDAYCYIGVCHIGGCEPGWDNCDGANGNGCEADLQGDTSNCGICGQVCAYDHATPVCNGGSCEVGACDPGWNDCNGQITDGCEADLWGDANNCGDCTTVCGPYDNAIAICAAGACRMSCDADWADCNASMTDGCETSVLADPDNCGACSTTCDFPHATGQCVDGGCIMGACEAGWEDCNAHPVDGCEIDLASDAENCSACGSACVYANGTGECVASVCGLASCDAGWANCNGDQTDGCETFPNTDPDHCGGCGLACDLPGVDQNGCVDGSCTVIVCDAGLTDCDADPANGCEADVNNDTAHCGACGNACSFPNATPRCSAGSCEMGTCDADFGDCNADPSDGCEVSTTSSDHCGGCDVTCAPPATCIQSTGAWSCGAACADNDNDTVSTCDTPADCDDNDADVYPGADEICSDLKDNDCDGSTDESDCVSELEPPTLHGGCSCVASSGASADAALLGLLLMLGFLVVRRPRRSSCPSDGPHADAGSEQTFG